MIGDKAKMNKTSLKGKPLLVFNELIAENGNETKAYQNVYKSKYETANKNAHNYMVKNGIREEYEKHLQRLKDKVSKDAEVTLKEIINNACFVIEKCKENPEKIDKLNLIRANDQLGKIIGAFKEVKRHKHEISEKRKKAVEKAAQTVIDTRSEFTDSTLADLYDPLSMPPKLTKAHEKLDKTVDKCYRSQPFTNELNRMQFLFSLYEGLIKKAEKT